MTTFPAATGTREATVRRVRPEDAARMRALRLEMLADSPLAFLETLAEAAARSHTEYAERVEYCSTGSEWAQFVADPTPPRAPRPAGAPTGNRTGNRLVGNRLVGHAGGTALPDEPEVTVIYAVYVTPAWRGSGLLAQLVDRVADWSRACGRPDLMLEVVVGNDRALRAYQRLGFTDTGVRVPHPKIPALTELQLRRPA
ncbi:MULTISPECIES: GNAT family N-acetyltransferase [Micromonospora]|uniref:Acetyltransferase (GNAT) family protein n=1 Tax=Micromonospora yangpuensis TaxID=683228 RepID=A0A1C6VD31_9ACTN|nr:GNAT family N-acetyltransferase [Micromonospora yangpuensis]GGM13593.1 N-acetyltransferase [Micromonospora yangpuensis]SCL64259.1 Acetyltransferase (GNAT) family protein [Micromonospora yangpuensis]